MFLVNPYIGNMDLIPPGSFEPDPPSIPLLSVRTCAGCSYTFVSPDNKYELQGKCLNLIPCLPPYSTPTPQIKYSYGNNDRNNNRRGNDGSAYTPKSQGVSSNNTSNSNSGSNSSSTKNNSNNSNSGSNRVRVSITDRLLNSTHALRCISITPSRPAKALNPFSFPHQFHTQQPLGMSNVQHVQFLEVNWECNIGRHVITDLRPQLRDGSRGEVKGRIDGRDAGNRSNLM